MAKKAPLLVVAFAIVHSLVQSQETNSDLACEASEESLEYRSSPSASVLLQVDSSQLAVQRPPGDVQKAKVHLEKAMAHLDKIDGHGKNDSRPVSLKDLLRHTKPMQEQIDGIKERVGSLETTVGRIHSNTAPEAGPAEPAGEHEESGHQQHQPDASNVDNEHHHGADEDWAWNNEKDEREDRPQGRSDDSKKMAQEDPGDTTDKPMRRKGEAPDWGGVAPKAWNGLENVRAEDSGPDASWKGKGTGVSSGEKYSGKYPYEIMMDVDFVVDSNPEPTKEPTTKAPTTKAPTTRAPRPESKPGTTVEPQKPGKSGSKHGGKAKSQPKHGGKESRPKAAPKTSPKTSPLTPAKTAPKGGGKSRTSPIHGGKVRPSEPAKTSPVHSGKSRTRPNHGGKGKPNSPVSGGKSSSLQPARIGPKQGGKGKSSSDRDSEPA